MGNIKGSTLVLNLLVMVVFSIMAAVVYKSAQAMVGEAVYYERSAQALTIAESGLEDALHSLYSTATWRTGFTQKAFAGGYYTVTVTSPTSLSLLVTSSGYSASILLGRAVRTVSATVVFVSTANPTNAVLSSNLTINGSVDAYDPRVSFTPTAFTDGGTIWANTIDTGGSCGSVRIRSNVIVFNAAPPTVASGNSPGSGCVNTPTDTITSTNTTVVLPLHTCNATCQAAAAINNATISASYRSGSALNETLTIGSAQTLTLSSGTYYFKQVFVDGILNLDTNSGPVNIYYTNQWRENSTCAVNNLGKIPSSLLIADVGGGHTLSLSCPAPLHAYVENASKHVNVNAPAQVYGHLTGDVVTIDLGAALHFDLSAAVPATHVTWATGPSGSWKESYKRQ